MHGRETAIGIGWLALAAALRLPAMGSQLWLDEVWTLSVLENLRGSPRRPRRLQALEQPPAPDALDAGARSGAEPGPLPDPVVPRRASPWCGSRGGSDRAADGARRRSRPGSPRSRRSSCTTHPRRAATSSRSRPGSRASRAWRVALDGRRGAGALMLAASAAIGLLSQLLYPRGARRRGRVARARALAARIATSGACSPTSAAAARAGRARRRR